MSRTDKTVPFRVQQWVDPARRQAVHDHRVGECDLPTDIRGHLEARTRCSWRSEWTYWGAALCPCELCHSGKWCRAENRRDRRASRRSLCWLATRHRAGAVDLAEGHLDTRRRRR
jgi:hypothetical protein